jgi:hypothetical protein
MSLQISDSVTNLKSIIMLKSCNEQSSTTCYQIENVNPIEHSNKIY